MSSRGALEGHRVLDFSSVGPAARCSRILADYGADVVKVSPTPRRGAVQIDPPFYAYGAHRGMRRMRVDLKADGGREALLRLAARSDVLLESFRPGVADRLGIGYRDVSRVNERIVYCSTSGYGQAGPHASWAGHDLNYLAVGGFLACTSPRSDGGPPIPGATVADSAGGGMHAAIAILAALLRRRAGSRGEYLDVAVADGVLSFTSLYVDEYLATGSRPGPGHDVLTGRYACYDLYPARDGRWLSVAAIEPVFYANLCRALDLERWIEHQTDDDRQDEIRADFRRAFARRDRDAWVAELAPADTCVAPVYSVEELVEDAQFASRGAFATARSADRGEFRQVGPLLAGMRRAGGPPRIAAPGETDTDRLLAEAGLSEAEIGALRRQGAVA